MEYKLESLTCPACSAPICHTDRICKYCGGAIVKIKKDHSEFKSTASNNLESCFHDIFELLDGRKPYLCDRKTIDKCLNSLDIICESYSDPQMDYLRAYIEYDYFERKHLNRMPNYMFYYDRAISAGITQEEISELEQSLRNKIIIGG